MSKRKAGNSDKGNPNEDIVEFLMELSNYERNVNRNSFKANAYKKASGVIANLPERVTSGAEARKLNGVGEKISDKIDEFLSTGKLRKLEKIRGDESTSIINQLASIVGIGPAKARELYDSGIRSVDDLREKKDHLTRAQQIGLTHYEDFELRIPRAEIVKIESILRSEIAKVDPKFKITICGSYRRGLATSGDVDVLITHEDYVHSESPKKQKDGGEHNIREVVSALEKIGLITDTISFGDKKFMGVCRIEVENEGPKPFRRLDLRLFPIDQFYFGVLYFTGSDEFNKKMRAHALDKGFTLNEYSLRPLKELNSSLPVSSEEDIFDYIEFPYKSPHERSL